MHCLSFTEPDLVFFNIIFVIRCRHPSRTMNEEDNVIQLPVLILLHLCILSLFRKIQFLTSCITSQIQKPKLSCTNLLVTGYNISSMVNTQGRLEDEISSTALPTRQTSCRYFTNKCSITFTMKLTLFLFFVDCHLFILGLTLQYLYDVKSLYFIYKLAHTFLYFFILQFELGTNVKIHIKNRVKHFPCI